MQDLINFMYKIMVLYDLYDAFTLEEYQLLSFLVYASSPGYQISITKNNAYVNAKDNAKCLKTLKNIGSRAKKLTTLITSTK
ncbi:hypothetical protein nvc1_074 [Namao virus]|nr:hypothetical protein nvc1_074 [Namao virus]